MANKIIVTEQRLGYYHGKLITLVDSKDAAVLEAAKAHAEEYANGLADNYEAAGSVATAQQALEALITAEKERAEGVEAGFTAQLGANENLTTDAKGTIVAAINEVKATAAADVAAAQQAVEALITAEKERAEGAESGLGERIDTVEGHVGTLDNLATNAKGDLVNAINEVRSAVSAGGTAAAISLDTSTTTEGALKSYTLYQGDSKIGVIDIPKDMVVESGEVVTNPEGHEEGTYIKLVLANVTEPLYINVGTLVDIYKAQANAAQVQVTIDSSTREISAAIVAGSIGTTELADDSVTTAKIVDNNVTKVKLSTALQASIDKADAAAPQTALDAEAQRAAAAEAKALEDANKHSDDLNTAMDARMQVVEGKAHEHANAEELAKIVEGDKAKWDAAEQNAKDYADGLVAGVDLSGIAANAEAIEALEGTHATDKAALEESIAGVQAKCDELDTKKSNVGHTHSWNDLEDKPFGEEVATTVLIPETSERNYYITETYDGGWAVPKLKAGDECIVTVDGVKYSVVAYDLPINEYGDSEVCLGDSRLYVQDETDNSHPEDVPFNISYMVNDNGNMSASHSYWITVADSNTHTVKVEKVTGGSTIKTLDEQFIPATIARTSDVTALTATHNADKAALTKSISDLEASFVEIEESAIDAWFAE